MDNWNAPQWADFNASLMSDIDEYFNTEHKELEPIDLNTTPYASFTESPNSKTGESRSSYNTPRSNGCASPCAIPASVGSDGRANKTGDCLTPAMRALKIKAMRQSMTPSALKAKIAAARASLPSRAEQKDESTKTNVEETRTVAVAETRDAECPETSLVKMQRDSTSEDENAENNATMIASSTDIDRSVGNFVGHIDAAEPEMPEKPETIGENSTADNEQQSTKLSPEKMIKNNTDPEIRTIDERSEPPKPDIPPSPLKKLENPEKPEKIGKNSTADELKKSTKVPFEKIIENITKPEIRTIDKRSEPSKPDIPRNPLKKLVSDKKIVRTKPERPRVLTSQVRRHSMAKYHRRSAQYVSLAEAVSRFQNGTPERFKPANNRENKLGPLQKTKQTTMKLTCPMSPALLCKFRTRAVSATNPNSQNVGKITTKNSANDGRSMKKIPTKSSSFPRSLPSVREKSATRSESSRKIEKIPPALNEKTAIVFKSARKIEKIPPSLNDKSSIGSKSVRKIEKIPSLNEKSTIGSNCARKIEKIPSSNEKSSIVGKPSRTIEKIPSSSNEKIISMPPPKVQPSMFKKIDKILGNSLSAKDASMMSTTIMSESMRKHTPCKKTVPTVVSTDEGIAIKDVEILHFGIPVGNDHKKITRTMPFSFDTRAKESKTKKEQLKNQRTEPETGKKTFHARPAPSFGATSSKPISVLRSKENCENADKPIVRTMSFQERNELALKKKKEMIDRIVEGEKRARVFHAKPAPNFKPVFVRGNSAENLRIGEGKGRARGISPVGRQAENNLQPSVPGNQENKPPIGTNQQLPPKLKNPLMTQNLKIKKTAM